MTLHNEQSLSAVKQKLFSTRDTLVKDLTTVEEQDRQKIEKDLNILGIVGIPEVFGPEQLSNKHLELRPAEADKDQQDEHTPFSMESDNNTPAGGGATKTRETLWRTCFSGRQRRKINPVLLEDMTVAWSGLQCDHNSKVRKCIQANTSKFKQMEIKGKT